jgi:hypothetical protein
MGHPHCLAKLAAGRHIILKERLTAAGRLGGSSIAGAAPGLREIMRKPDGAWHIRRMIRAAAPIPKLASIRNALRRELRNPHWPSDVPRDAAFMPFFSTAQHIARESSRGHMIPIMLAGAVTACAITLVAYLLWPTWGPETSSGPARLPVSIGNTLFNVPTTAIRMKIQRHSGPQERIDLNFAYPSLEAPDAPKHVSADTLEEAVPPIDRIFLSISAHHDALAPDARMRTIYPRYLEQASSPGQDGLTMRAFRDGTPYSNEDLFFADMPDLSARCSRDAATPGMCLSERRIDGADLMFRFPRSWLSQWRDVANAMERLTVQLHGTKG